MSTPILPSIHRPIDALPRILRNRASFSFFHLSVLKRKQEEELAEVSMKGTGRGTADTDGKGLRAVEVGFAGSNIRLK